MSKARKIVVGDCFEFEGNTYALDLRDGEPPLIEIPEWWGFRTFVNGKQRVLFGYAGRNSIVPTLHLPISEPWFSRILSGEKTEEYREIKEYNGVRLIINWNVTPFPPLIASDIWEPKPLKVLHLTNGYGHHRPQLWAHIEEITIGKGKPECGAPEHDVFIIKLGEVFHTKNLKK